MKRMNAHLVFLNLPAMKANSWWIKTDYWMQTVLGSFVLISAITVVGFFIALMLLIPLGAWQIISGLVSAFRGDRLQQIYLGVVAVHFSLWFYILENHGVYTTLGASIIISLIVIGVVIGIWKYTIARADYISLDIITVENIDHDDLLDA